MKTFLLAASIIILLLMLLVAYVQEKLLFHPRKLTVDHAYNFEWKFEEVNFETSRNVTINGLHFKAENPRGVIFYLHGNAGALDSWGHVALQFLQLNYDVLIIDYRGFGKSTGRISERGLFHDAQFIYNKLKEQYGEDKIVVYGRSIGTGIAAYVAAHNSPGKLILETPYYSMKDLVNNLYPAAPAFILRYKFKTNEFLPKVKCPVCLFHGTEDEIIYYGSSVKLQQLFKPGDTLIMIKGGRHNDLERFAEYRNGLKQILEQ